MRRMIPQKLIDYIKEIKSKVSIDNNGNITMPSLKIGSITLDQNGLDLGGDIFNIIGDGLEVDGGELEVSLATNSGLEFVAEGGIGKLKSTHKPLYKHDISVDFYDPGQSDISSLTLTCISTQASEYDHIPYNYEGDIIMCYCSVNINDTGNPSYLIFVIYDNLTAFGIEVTGNQYYPQINNSIDLSVGTIDTITDSVHPF